MSQKIWKAPEPSELKLNVDGAIFVERNKVGVGSVLQDAEGRVIMAATKSETHTSDPLEIEFSALFRGVQLCVPLGIQKLKIESDSLLAIEAIDKGESSCAQHSNLIQEIKKLQQSFMQCSFQYVSRLGIMWRINLPDIHGKLRILVFGGILSRILFYLHYE